MGLESIWEEVKGVLAEDLGVVKTGDQADRKSENVIRGEQLDAGKKKKGTHPPPHHGPAVVFRDVVVALSTLQHRGKEGIGTVASLERFVWLNVVSKQYFRTTDRDLTVIGAFVDEPGTSIVGVANRVNKLRLATGQRIGHLMLYGISFGGKRVIELAHMLQARAGVTYVGVSDGAFFDADTMNTPHPTTSNTANTFEPINVPVMSPQFCPPGRAAARNVYQWKGNRGKFTAALQRDAVWTSFMKHGEIHGELPGFINTDVSAECNMVDHTKLHVQAAHRGEDIILGDIKTILSRVDEKAHR